MTAAAQLDFDETAAMRQASAKEAQEWPPAWRAVGWTLRAAWWVLWLFTP